MEPKATRRPRRSEDGAVAILVAMSMIGLLVVAGMVMDFGLIRADKTANKAATDSAAAAGVRVLDGGDGNTRPFQGACTALAYLKANDVELDGTKLTGSWKYGNLAPVTGDPCVPGSAVYDDTTCVPSNTATWAWFSGTADAGRISVDIKTGYTFPDATLVPGTTAKAFPEDATVSDPGVASQGGCDQLAVVMQETEKPGLGSLATSSSLTTSVRSVGRLTLNSTSEAAAALVLLERSGCPALTLNSAAAGVLVKGSGATPGSIHADSNGSVGCSAGTPVLQGNHSNAVIAEPAVTGSPARGGHHHHRRRHRCGAGCLRQRDRRGSEGVRQDRNRDVRGGHRPHHHRPRPSGPPLPHRRDDGFERGRGGIQSDTSHSRSRRLQGGEQLHADLVRSGNQRVR